MLHSYRTYIKSKTISDLLNLMVTKEQQISRCNVNKDAWIQSNIEPNHPANQVVLTFLTINSALEYVNKRLVNEIEEVNTIG